MREVSQMELDDTLLALNILLDKLHQCIIDEDMDEDFDRFFNLRKVVQMVKTNFLVDNDLANNHKDLIVYVNYMCHNLSDKYYIYELDAYSNQLNNLYNRAIKRKDITKNLSH